MATGTIKFDSVTKRQLAVDTTTPVILLDEARLSARFSTASGTFTCDNAYPTGGYGPMNKFGLSSVARVLFETPSGYKFWYNAGTDKIQVFSSGETEVTNGTDLHTVTAGFEAKGLS